MNIENSVLDYIRYKQLNWYDHVQRKNFFFLNGLHLEEEEEEKDAGSNNWNERKAN